MLGHKPKIIRRVVYRHRAMIQNVLFSVRIQELGRLLEEACVGENNVANATALCRAIEDFNGPEV